MRARTETSAVTGMRAALRAVVNHRLFGQAVVVLVLFNAFLLGLETLPSVTGDYGPLLKVIDRIILALFVGELTLRFVAYGWRFLRDPWSLFDTVVVGISLVPASNGFSVLRALRILRMLRLISALPRLRRVVQGLVDAVPGLGSVAGILLILLYVFAVMAAKLFGADHPYWFDGVHRSLFTLFQVMTLEGWADIVRVVMKTHPYAWAFFLTYILLSTFTVLNFFIAVIVDAMQKGHQDEEDRLHASLAAIRRDIAILDTKLATLTAGSEVNRVRSRN